jgi:phosphoribosylanthranilate isomerase
MKLKVCGMKQPEQIQQLADLAFDFVGFIFYPKSSRYVGDLDPIESPANLKRVGVFVNEGLDQIQELAERWRLDYLQLHGDESPAYCQALKVKGYQLIKVFGIKSAADFQQVQKYEELCEYFLFDTKGKQRGGNGYAFDWQLLEAYDGDQPYFLSGGIGLGDEAAILELAKRDERLVAVDLNSRFEKSSTNKDLGMLKQFLGGLITVKN